MRAGQNLPFFYALSETEYAPLTILVFVGLRCEFNYDIKLPDSYSMVRFEVNGTYNLNAILLLIRCRLQKP